MNRSMAMAIILLLAVCVFAVGSYVYSSRIDRDAAQVGSATSGPNVKEQQEDKAARGPSTTGSKTQGAVPPASR